MIALAVLLGLAVLAVPVATVILMISVSELKRRVAALESELRTSRGSPGLPRADTKAAQVEAAQVPSTAEVETGPLPEPYPAWPGQPLEAPEGLSEPSGPREPRFVQLRALAGWLYQNWFYAISAVSLGLAGIFLVQYGVETGLLTPTMRVLLAIALGLALIASGETIRRRYGDEEDRATAFLPSTFSASGIVVLYAAVLAARTLYGLIGPELAFAGLVAISSVALVFGWFYGPFLAAAGIGGAAAAPFLVGGSAESGTLFYIYYGLLGATGLAIDALRRWGWVSLLALVLAYLMGTVVYAEGGEFQGFAALLVWLALAAIALPRLELWPSHPGPTILEGMAQMPRAQWAGIIPPTFIAAGAVAASCVTLLLFSRGLGATEQYLAAGALTVLGLALILWASAARGLSDLALIPAGAFLSLLFEEAAGKGGLYREVALFDWSVDPEAWPPMTVTILLGLATLTTLAAAWRSFQGTYAAPWAAAATVFAPATAVLFEIFWHPAPVIGGYFWAGHAIALAALMTFLAERFARADGEDRRRAAYAVLSALSLVALALFILLAEAALTVALSVLVVVAAALDRRFGLPEMRLFLLAGTATLGWRLIVDPGLPDYLENAPLWEVLLAFGSALAGLGAGLALLPGARRRSRALLESALWAYGGTLATVLLWRGIDAVAEARGIDPFTHWAASLLGIVWTALCLAQIYRLRQSRELRWLRIALAALYALLALIAFGLALTLLNPFAGLVTAIEGVQPFDTLGIAYALPALGLAAVAAKAKWLPRRMILGWISGVFAATWVFLEIRWFWQGDLIGARGFSQPELYSYTVALLLAGGGLLYQAMARQSTALRRLALVVIGLAVAKVFLIDASGLTGLLRVFSFLALGLVLAGLAWLDRWAAGRSARGRAGRQG